MEETPFWGVSSCDPTELGQCHICRGWC